MQHREKFTATPELDSEGFVARTPVWYDDKGVLRHTFDGWAQATGRLNLSEFTPADAVGNPFGWNEPGMQPITWANYPETPMFEGKSAIVRELAEKLGMPIVEITLGEIDPIRGGLIT